MTSLTRQLYLFLAACGGNWRNTIFVTSRRDFRSVFRDHVCTVSALAYAFRQRKSLADAVAGTIFNRLWESSLMSKAEAYRWLQVQMGLPREEAHIAKFSELRCQQVMQLCKKFLSAHKHAA